MKRDMDLVREILLAVEADEGDPEALRQIDVPGHDGLEIAYHIQIVAEAGFIEAEELTSNTIYDWRAKRLTWDGHEFLDTVRDTETWNEVKSGAAKAGAASLQFLWEIGKEIAKQKLKQHTGMIL
jgi:hypothetical protein